MVCRQFKICLFSVLFFSMLYSDTMANIPPYHKPDQSCIDQCKADRSGRQASCAADKEARDEFYDWEYNTERDKCDGKYFSDIIACDGDDECIAGAAETRDQCHEANEEDREENDQNTDDLYAACIAASNTRYSDCIYNCEH